jgi:Flp pilus assembly protein TadD
MTFPRLRSIAALLLRSASYVLVFVGTHCIAANPGDQRIALAQSTSSRPTPAKSQKVSNPLNDLLDEAQHDIDQNNFEGAITPLEHFLAEKPDVAYAHFQLAYAYTALQRSDEARAEYERTITLDPKMSEAYLNLGILLTDRDPPAAVLQLRKAVELLPSQSRPRILLAVAQERSGEVAAAADSLEAALRLEPRDGDALVRLGRLYLGTKRALEAEAKFRSAFEIQPNSAPAGLGLAQSLDAQGKPEAAQAYQKYLELRPSDVAARDRLVHLLVDQQKYDEALAELNHSDQGRPPALDSLRLRADIQIAQNKLDDAVVTLQKAVALSPGDAQLVGGLGRIYMQKRDFPSAEQELKAALRLDPTNLVYWKDLSSTYYLSGNCPATLAALDVVAKAEPPTAISWFIRALCYDKLHQAQPALDAYQKFLAMDQDKNPDQVWQAQQRSKVLKRMLEQKR